MKTIWRVSYLSGIAVTATLAGLMLVGGVWLIQLGGSPIYALIGLILAFIAFTLALKSQHAFYGVLALLGVVGPWALYEAGTDYWALFPRLYIPVAVGAMVCLLIFKTSIIASGHAKVRRIAGAVAATLILALGAALVPAFFPHHQVRATLGSAKDTFLAGMPSANNDWAAYGGTTYGTRFSKLDQISTENVHRLEVAWTYRTGDIPDGDAAFQGTPLKIGSTLYLCTPYSKVIALDPSTGKEKWRFDPNARTKEWQRCRGLAYHEDAENSITADSCRQRIITTTIDARLFAIDAKTGRPCRRFGDNGAVNLLAGLGPSAVGTYFPTSAPLVAGDLVITGARMQDWESGGQPSGVVRAWNVHNGSLVWAWDPADPKRGTPLPENQNYIGETPNFWGTASYDPKLELIYIPTGNQTPDFWGAGRHPASDEFNSSIVAIDARTGRSRWHFRTVNHDLFDYDVGAQPILYDIKTEGGGTRPALVLLTKRGQIFVLDRQDGTPIIPVEMRSVPTAGAPEGQYVALQQPYSQVSVGAYSLTEKDTWGITLLDQLYCRIQFKRFRWEGEFTPVNTNPTLMYPGYYGGFNWGGGAIDQTSGFLIVNDIRAAHWIQFIRHRDALAAGLVAGGPTSNYVRQRGAPYGARHGMFASPLGIPCTKPPFGTMTAIDLSSGRIIWQVPMGSTEDSPVLSAVRGIHLPIGMPTIAGPLVTGGGITFFSGTMDRYVRALDSATGRQLWKARIPVGSQSTPVTYTHGPDNKQYVVITAGGSAHSRGLRGDYVVAYSLPAERN